MPCAIDDFAFRPRRREVLRRITEDVYAEGTVVGAVKIERGHGWILQCRQRFGRGLPVGEGRVEGCPVRRDDVGDVVGRDVSTQLIYVIVRVVSGRPVAPQRFPEAGLQKYLLGKTGLLDDPDVERPLELAVAEHRLQNTGRWSSQCDETAECRRV